MEDMIITPRGKYRLVRRKPLTVTQQLTIRVPSHCSARPGDTYLLYESDEGNLMLMADPVIST